MNFFMIINAVESSVVWTVCIKLGSHCATTCDIFEVPIAKCDDTKHVWYCHAWKRSNLCIKGAISVGYRAMWTQLNRDIAVASHCAIFCITIAWHQPRKRDRKLSQVSAQCEPGRLKLLYWKILSSETCLNAIELR